MRPKLGLNGSDSPREEGGLVFVGTRFPSKPKGCVNDDTGLLAGVSRWRIGLDKDVRLSRFVGR